jgi:hypothetical protein
MKASFGAMHPEATSPWEPYVPHEQAPWSLRRVVHLHRRAGFAATWHEIQRDLKDGPKASIDRVLAGRAATDGVPEDFEKVAGFLSDSASVSNDPARLKAWWIYRMLFGPFPLTERLVLLWHNHFATSNLKVEDLPAMRRQNDLFRRMGRGLFGELLSGVVEDPALLAWLDAANNRKGRPNENLARELMELFTMGIGNYTEADVKESARALTVGSQPSSRRALLASPTNKSTSAGRTSAGSRTTWSCQSRSTHAKAVASNSRTECVSPVATT